jgi:hypothetical protein
MNPPTFPIAVKNGCQVSPRIMTLYGLVNGDALFQLVVWRKIKLRKSGPLQERAIPQQQVEMSPNHQDVDLQRTDGFI